jgi:UDP-N-acetyl-D-glucosamine dehydrogenase
MHVARKLIERGAMVRYADPHVSALALHDGVELPRAELTRPELEATDLVVITTQHAAVDWDLVCQHAPLVLDTRGVRSGRGRPGWHTL